MWMYLLFCSSRFPPSRSCNSHSFPPFLPHPCFTLTINYSTCSFHKLYVPLCQLHACRQTQLLEAEDKHKSYSLLCFLLVYPGRQCSTLCSFPMCVSVMSSSHPSVCLYPCLSLSLTSATSVSPFLHFSFLLKF